MPNQEKQKELVVNQLFFNGYVSRNWALQNYISRLGAIVYKLKKEGYQLRGEWFINDDGRDYLYREEIKQA